MTSEFSMLSIRRRCRDKKRRTQIDFYLRLVWNSRREKVNHFSLRTSIYFFDNLAELQYNRQNDTVKPP